MTHTTGHAVLIVLQYLNAHMLIQESAVLEGTVAVDRIAIGALLQH